MLMNENSELRSFVSCSKNFSKNIINKSIKNNIVPINNDGGVKSKRKHRGFIPSTFGVTVTCINFFVYILFLIVICIISIFLISIFLIFILSLIVAYSFIYISSSIVNHISSVVVFISLVVISFLIVAYSLIYIVCFVVLFIVIRILIQISNISPINISFSSSFISFIYISFISFIIFTSFTGLFISDNTVITI